MFDIDYCILNFISKINLSQEINVSPKYTQGLLVKCMKTGVLKLLKSIISNFQLSFKLVVVYINKI